ncbi:MAG: aminoglycoside phosphotransferase [Gammaproteobacteria bacterium HGW-Gammaproteobacteria-3]|nr:MAG: aminoglycoside phosphotransferase [Gammaproteobacteria bacterium HGW-Gammaproteobacteria-3]
METHISWVLLAGRHAYKIKKPVDFGFLDFSTLEKRHFYCLEEVRLNRRLAEVLYLDVIPITGSDRLPQFGGPGTVIEYAVKMQRFQPGRLLSECAEKGLLGTSEIDQIAGLMSRFHQTADVAAPSSPYGKAEDIKYWAEDNFNAVIPLLNNDKALQRVRRIAQWSRNEGLQKSAIMRKRKQQGFIREGHGDLHLANMTLIDGRVTVFDCLEFNPQLRWIDVINDLAFVIMDLACRNLAPYGYRLLNGYLQQTGDYAGLGLLRYYLVYRAMVRAKVALLRARQTSDSSESGYGEYAGYISLAEDYIRPLRPRLIITHGVSGSGKSFFAGALAESLGAIQLRSDVERKRLFGFKPLEDSRAKGIDIYTPEAGRKTFRRLAELAESILGAGFTVIVDATFIRAGQRSDFYRIAQACNVPFLILDFRASEPELQRRLAVRQRSGNDASEATENIMRQQLQAFEPLTDEEKKRALTVDTENEKALALLLAALVEKRDGQGNHEAEKTAR